MPNSCCAGKRRSQLLNPKPFLTKKTVKIIKYIYL